MPQEKDAKVFVLDSSVLLYSPWAINAFDDNDVVIPRRVVKELRDKTNTETGELRANARQFGELLEELSIKGQLQNGVALPGGGKIFVLGDDDLPAIDVTSRLPCAPGEFKNRRVILVSRSPYERSIARIRNLEAEEYKSESILSGGKLSNYTGRCELFVNPLEMAEFREEGALTLNKQNSYYAIRCGDASRQKNEKYNLTVNEYVILRDMCKPSGGTMLGRFDGEKIVRLRGYNPNNTHPVFGVKPLNVGQIFALDMLLLPPEVAPLVILKGPAGTAKTFLSMAAALAQTIDNYGGENTYTKILITRPNAKMDADIGFLKGDEQEKVMPVLRGLTDNVDALIPNLKGPIKKDGMEASSSSLDNLIAQKIIEPQALAYFRGRSIANQFVIADETQNATPTQILSIITRNGEGSKLVLLGDCDQIDHPYLDKRNNGLAYASDKMQGSKFCFQLTFDESECVRSPLAADAIARLTPKGAAL